MTEELSEEEKEALLKAGPPRSPIDAKLKALDDKDIAEQVQGVFDTVQEVLDKRRKEELLSEGPPPPPEIPETITDPELRQRYLDEMKREGDIRFAEFKARDEERREREKVRPSKSQEIFVYEGVVDCCTAPEFMLVLEDFDEYTDLHEIVTEKYGMKTRLRITVEPLND